jgi:hypothetical protein
MKNAMSVFNDESIVIAGGLLKKLLGTEEAHRGSWYIETVSYVEVNLVTIIIGDSPTKSAFPFYMQTTSNTTKNSICGRNKLDKVGFIIRNGAGGTRIYANRMASWVKIHKSMSILVERLPSA